jgi:hypothetical protein
MLCLLAANVCVSAVVRFRSRVLSHETKRITKIKTYSVHLTAPLQKHFVVGRSLLLSNIQSLVQHRFVKLKQDFLDCNMSLYQKIKRTH